MKNVVEEFIPFEHQNLEYINGSLNLARQQRQSGTAEGMMAAAVIYTNLVEYLASNLLDNLQQMIFLLSQRSFHSIFFVKSRIKDKSRSPRTLGQLRYNLADYEFPNSANFLLLIEKFASTRNAIFHRLLTVSKKDLDEGKVDEQFSILHNLAEEILDKYNTIIQGVEIAWYSAVASQQTDQPQTRGQVQA